ncbi:hypothetical protein F5Y19DRAFT_173247 [Xylariaceae sp. FL1651]|nr:hypothetical protein F5Y19DRAFT_173247 [Xylariaceae sp. FL1651]
MRSRPYTAPPQQAPWLHELSAYLPNASRNRTNLIPSDAALHADVDPETNQLLPRRQRQHRVRIQGQLAVVRTVSVANLRQANNVSPGAQAGLSREDVRGAPPRRRNSCGGSEAEEQVDDDDDATIERDAQFRGYGIGGAGNIRRPTDVMGTPSSTSLSLSSLIASSTSLSSRPLGATNPDKWRRRVTTILRSLGGRPDSSKASVGG